MRPAYGRPTKHNTKPLEVRWWALLGLAVALAIGALTLRKTDDGLRDLCATYYRAARTAADTQRVDKRIVDMIGKIATTCGSYRTPLR